MNSTVQANQKANPDFAQNLLRWYDENAREMPWRVSPSDYAVGERQDPYKVWMSEIMLQQTQVATVKDYYLKFIANWPTVEQLAAADLEDVLKAWAGLGYYSRARNLKKCAEIVWQEYEGEFPREMDKLLQLPGIGDYTAAAISSIAFDQPSPVVDGNVERVMSRVFKIETPFPKAKQETKLIVESLLDKTRPGEFAQATMDLGATLCTPKRPACGLCPVSLACVMAHSSENETYPKKLPKKKKPTRFGAAYILVNSKQQVWLNKRPEAGLLAGMTQVPTTRWTAQSDGDQSVDSAPIKGNWRSIGIAKHTFTHFHLSLKVWHLKTDEVPEQHGWWADADGLNTEALPKVMHKVLALL